MRWHRCLMELAGVTLLLALSSNAQTTASWAPSQSRDITYHVVIEHGLKQGQPEFTEEFDLSLSFPGDGTVQISRVPRSSVTMALTSGGNLIVHGTEDPPPYVGILLLQSLPPEPLQMQMGTKWETRLPRDVDLGNEQDKLGLQDRQIVRVASLQGNVASLEIRGETRGLRNRGAQRLLGADLPKFERLFRWNLSLVGTAQYDSIKFAIQQAEMFYVLKPVPGLTDNTLKQDASRHHLTLKRVD